MRVFCSAFTRPCSRYNHTKVGATNSVNLLFPFERLLLRTNLSHKSKAASSVYRQDQPLNCRKSPNIVYIHIYICVYHFFQGSPLCPFERYASFSPDTIHVSLADIGLRVVLLRYCILYTISSTSYCDAGAFVDSEVHHMNHPVKPTR